MRAARAVKKVQQYQKVFSGPDGRAVLYDLMQSAGMLTIIPDPNPNEALVQQGERNMVLKILLMLKADTQQLLERIEEHDDEMVP